MFLMSAIGKEASVELLGIPNNYLNENVCEVRHLFLKKLKTCLVLPLANLCSKNVHKQEISLSMRP